MRTNKEILAVVNQMVSDGQIAQDIAEKYFPELRESKDERMMKIIMNALIKVPYSELDGLIPDTIRIWLEEKIKQGEQEPAEWSEEDEELCEYLIKSIEESDPLPTSISSDCKRWLKTLKGRVLPQSKQDWKPSEDQMIALKCAITTADEKWVCMNTKDLESLYEDLKKLKE